MSGSLIRAQACRAGRALVAAPLMAGLIVALVSWGAAMAWPTSQAMVLVLWLSQVFVICAGVCLAVAVTGDPLIELHESTPTAFRTVLVLRAGIVTLSGIAGAAVMFTPLHLLGVWPQDEGWLSLASPVGAVIIVAVVAGATAAFSGSVSATTIAVVAAWMFLAMLWDPYVLSLLPQRGLPLLAAAVPALIAWRRLGDPEHNIVKAAMA